jgi:hypothetical protein
VCVRERERERGKEGESSSLQVAACSILGAMVEIRRRERGVTLSCRDKNGWSSQSSMGSTVHVAPAYVGSREESDHFGSYARNLSLYFCKRLFPARLETMTSWSKQYRNEKKTWSFSFSFNKEHRHKSIIGGVHCPLGSQPTCQ